ncbi:MAG: peptide-methionine (S)-S-oxide reductase MsrA [Nitrospirae bacterium]|nr:peptide-methionine (S)-S-oxide reductase MsrA [Nitrospirota bacterium]MBI5696505.1 peptide-methionine (S)-S-oxide reductase MsrA [Nitrospirota bacterium]
MIKATFGAGCFWHVEEVFRRTPGVASTRVGYMGGKTRNPTYSDVCYKRTGHAEVVEVTYDPSLVTYDTLLEIFWEMHDPTSLNRQGPDIGEQYRSVIFYHNDEQRKKAGEAKARLAAESRYERPVVTAIEPAGEFFMAEEYHQQYLEKRGKSSCAS